MTRLILTRHGETEWNSQGFVQGSLDSPLTLTGTEQAYKLAQRLAMEKISHIYSSPLGRAVQTADKIAGQFGLQVKLCPEFSEISFGNWEGKAWKDLRQAEPQAFGEWERSAHTFRFPGGETMDDVLMRSRPKLLELCALHPSETICLVTHGITLKVLVTSLMGFPLSDWLQTPWQSNTALNIFEVNGDKAIGLVLGDSSHLEKQ